MVYEMSVTMDGWLPGFTCRYIVDQHTTSIRSIFVTKMSIAVLFFTSLVIMVTTSFQISPSFPFLKVGSFRFMQHRSSIDQRLLFRVNGNILNRGCLSVQSMLPTDTLPDSDNTIVVNQEEMINPENPINFNEDHDREGEKISELSSIPTLLITKNGQKKYIRRSVRNQLDGSTQVRDAAWQSLAVGQQLEVSSVMFSGNAVFVSLPSNIEGILSTRQLSGAENEALTAFKNYRDAGDRLLVEVKSTNMESGKVELKLIKIIRATDVGKIFENVNRTMLHNSTVVGHGDSGIVLRLHDYNVTGLLPSSRLLGYSNDQIMKLFPLHGHVAVKIDKVDGVNNKLYVGMDSLYSDVSLFADFPESRWLHCIVQAVSNFGLFVRPAGQDAIGLVAARDIPLNLITELKSRHGLQTTGLCLPLVFNVGDIIKARIVSVDVDSSRLDLTMLQHDQENQRFHEKGDKPNYRKTLDRSAMYDVMLWHNGTKFVPSPEPQPEEDDDNILEDPNEVNDRNWRRLFEIDAEADNEDFEANAAKRFEENLTKELGSMVHLLDHEDEYMVSPGYEHIFPTKPTFVAKALSPVPEEFLNALNGTFFEKEYRLRDEDIKYPSFSFDEFWGPVADQIEAEIKAKREARGIIRRGGSDRVVRDRRRGVRAKK